MGWVDVSTRHRAHVQGGGFRPPSLSLCIRLRPMRNRRKNSSPEIVVVRWHDAHADSAGTWVELSDIDPDPLLVTSVGILLPATTKPKHVSIAQSYADDLCDHVIHIPEKMVVDVTVLGVLDKPEKSS